MADRPTESAQIWFTSATHHYQQAIVYDKDVHTPETYMSFAGIDLAKGLKELSVGLRATYLLLEEVKRMLVEQGRRDAALRPGAGTGAADRW